MPRSCCLSTAAWPDGRAASARRRSRSCSLPAVVVRSGSVTGPPSVGTFIQAVRRWFRGRPREHHGQGPV
ncbi:hypothetical protein ACFFX0_27380 [Citricoccus parietis]|uniref:Uncharacterized protein n=1 Tax=Citricoccus parietis TaxID=592307 RepID=A0ABV5G6X9_9MICC